MNNVLFAANKVLCRVPLRLCTIDEIAKLACKEDESGTLTYEQAVAFLVEFDSILEIARALQKLKVDGLKTGLKEWNDYPFSTNALTVLYNEFDYMARQEYKDKGWFTDGDRTYRILMNVMDEYPGDSDLRREFSQTYTIYRDWLIELAKKGGIENPVDTGVYLYSRVVGNVHFCRMVDQPEEEFVKCMLGTRNFVRDLWFKADGITEIKAEDTWQHYEE